MYIKHIGVNMNRRQVIIGSVSAAGIVLLSLDSSLQESEDLFDIYKIDFHSYEARRIITGSIDPLAALTKYVNDKQIILEEIKPKAFGEVHDSCRYENEASGYFVNLNKNIELAKSYVPTNGKSPWNMHEYAPGHWERRVERLQKAKELFSLNEQQRALHVGCYIMYNGQLHGADEESSYMIVPA
jgi:hypothetical protein